MEFDEKKIHERPFKARLGRQKRELVNVFNSRFQIEKDLWSDDQKVELLTKIERVAYDLVSAEWSHSDDRIGFVSRYAQNVPTDSDYKQAYLIVTESIIK